MSSRFTGSDYRNETNKNERDFFTPTTIKTVVMEDELLRETTAGTYTLSHNDKFALHSSSILELWVTAKDQNYVGSETIELKAYRQDFPGVFSLVLTTSITTPSVTAGESENASVTDANDLIRSCSHFSVSSSSITVASGGSLVVKMGKLGAVAG
jgi:hypothetical protein